MIVAGSPNLISYTVFILSIFRLNNLMRITQGRINEFHLSHVVKRTSLTLIPLQLVLVWLLFALPDYVLTLHFLIGLATVQATAALVLAISTRNNIIKTRYSLLDKFLSDKELPTVTVAVPARNETAELSDCLQALVASDYPKLEIIVLDDCSQDKTSDIIKSFAQAGVRFIHGHEPKEKWLAKNQAYDELSAAATGQFIVFCGVDTRIEPGTIRAVVTYAATKNKDMICVLPQHLNSAFISGLIQPMRYWWELALPRKIFNRPAVLSSFWLIKSSRLKDLGGFSAVSRAVIPESYFAKQLVASDSYSFLTSTNDLAVISVKRFQDQFDRAIRMLYPQVHKRLELVALFSIIETTLFLGPLVLAIAGLVFGRAALYVPAIMSIFLLEITHAEILKLSSRPYRRLMVLNFPIMVAVEIVLGLLSMFKYEFSEVDWKGRNICLPVMHIAYKGPRNRGRFKRFN
jgi:glycosyltransferase involved in cell wall biosynthesis